jgi:hypothetical protein
MFEKSNDMLISTSRFILRFARSLILGWMMIALALYIGMLGYHEFEHQSWIDAFANAAMILSGMGPLGTLNTPEGKLFAGCYALFSGLAFIVIMGVIYAPIIHRLLHKFRLDTEKRK